MFQLITLLGIIILSVLIFRLFGAWMFRIDVVIKELKKINKNLENK